MSSTQLGTLQPDTEKKVNIRKSTLIVKRMLDIIISIICFIILLPLMLVIAVLIKIDSSGPVIFKQKRAGIYGRPFKIYKFRTMVQDAESQFKLDIDPKNINNFVFQDKDDPRVTKLGCFLRKTSLDELPQLLNVIKGDMSLIGPRPEIYDIVDLYDDHQRRRLDVKPGVTGLAQVKGRGELTLEQTIKHDLEYIDNLSIKMDLKLLFSTFNVVIRRKGAF